MIDIGPLTEAYQIAGHFKYITRRQNVKYCVFVL